MLRLPLKPNIVLTALVCIAWACTPKSTEQTAERRAVSVIPKPANFTEKDGQFTFTGETVVYVEPDSDESKRIAQHLVNRVNQVSGYELKVATGSPASENAVVLSTQEGGNSLGKEGYQLSVTPEQIMIRASQPNGVFYGVQTLYQLLPPEVFGSKQAVNVAWTVPYVEITDQPRYAWRGVHLDVGRHFFPVDAIKQYIDYLALHKLNTFHWHLTDDQGWRIEIKQYPKLTQVGAYRDQTRIGHANSQPEQYDGKRYGGFYTQEEAKEIVKYAQERYVTVVPEIEMPGHALAALSAYPELGCTEGPFKAATTWGVFEDIFCPKEETFTFLENVLSEVMPLFPGEYIHIGGDEAPKDRWRASKVAQSVIKREKLKDEHELQSYFIQRIEKFVNSKGKKIIGWDEILEGGLAPNAAVMSWRGTEGGIAAARQRHYVVMTPSSFCYLDYYQGDPALEPPGIGGLVTLKKVYSYEPTPAQLTAEEAKYIMGAQANVWTEYIKTPDHLEYMVLPRMSALAEVVWTEAKAKNWEDFARRMNAHYQRFDALGVNYSRSAGQVMIEPQLDTARNVTSVTLQTSIADPKIYYTLNGNEPDANATLYTQPFPVQDSVTVKAVAFAGGKPAGKVTSKKVGVGKKKMAAAMAE